MSRVEIGITPSLLFKRPVALLCTVVVLLFAQPVSHAQFAAAARPPLNFFKNYFLAGGDYAVGGIGLRGQGDPTTQLATGTIAMSGVPAGADISAAFLYWISLEPVDTDPMSEVGYFRGDQIKGKVLNPTGVYVPGCWGSGGGGTTSVKTTSRVYRADVLRNLPVSTRPETPGKVLVNDADLTLNQKALHQVKLRDSGGGGTQSPSTGNQVAYVEGASLVVVYRVPTSPLRAVVIYDGAVTADADFPVMNLTLKGFYQASATPTARMTHLVGNGDGFQEKLTINGTPVPGTNPFGGASGSAWDNAPYSVSGAIADSVSTKVEPVVSSIDCLEWGAVVLSTEVQDTDRDGIVDVVEDQSGLTDPNGQPLPDLHAMGASSLVKDLFVEIGFMYTTTANNPWPAGSNVGPHSHKPDKSALEMVAKAFKNAPVKNPNESCGLIGQPACGPTGINVHFDVGGNYQPASPPLPTLCADPATWTFDCAIIPTGLARGGEAIIEEACGADGPTKCQFFNNPGTVGWKSGYQYHRDAPVGDAGEWLSVAQIAACEAAGNCPTRRRFDSNRFDIFHYTLWAHALGLPKSPDQCLSPNQLDVEAGVCRNATGTIAPDNPDYHVPTKSSGFGDLGGGDVLISLNGFGNNFNGDPVTQAGTLMHELGHNFERKHGGEALERNCKPNYVSVMSYLFQVHGIWMLSASGEPLLGVDYSGQVLKDLDENQLSDSPLIVLPEVPYVPPQYPTRWYAPPSFIHTGLGLTVANKHCDGTLKTSTENMVRVDGTSATDSIDWRIDGGTTVSGISQDINFNGGPIPGGAATDGPFKGSDDWNYIKQWGLNQIASRPNMGLLSLDVGISDLGRGDPGRGDPGRGDPGRGDPGRGDPGRGDPGRGDPGRGDPGRGDPGAPPGDLDIDTATGHAQAPRSFKASKELKTVRLTWLPSFVRPEGVTVTSTVYRVAGTTITPTNFADRVLIRQAIAGTSTTDDKPLNGKPVVYILFENLSNGTKSAFVTTPFTFK